MRSTYRCLLYLFVGLYAHLLFAGLGVYVFAVPHICLFVDLHVSVFVIIRVSVFIGAPVYVFVGMGIRVSARLGVCWFVCLTWLSCFFMLASLFVSSFDFT